MDPVACSEYATEVLHWMRIKEDLLPKYKKASPQLDSRDDLVDFMRQVCENLKLSVLTTHLSVQLLDRFMDGHDISNEQLKLAALSVLFLGAKFEEKDSNIPRIPDLSSYVNNQYPTNMFNHMEEFMLNFFDWNVGSITAAHFLEYFLMACVTSEDFQTGGILQHNSADVHRQIWNSSQHYLDITLRDLHFLKYKCSQVAAACLACGRINASMVIPWPKSLEVITGYSIKMLGDCMEALLNFSREDDEKMEICGTPDSGYRTGSTQTPSSSLGNSSPLSMTSDASDDAFL